MRKIVVTLIVASLLYLTSVAPVFAGGWGGWYLGRGGGFTPLWPITAALSIPAAIIGTVVNLAATVPAPYDYAAPQAPEAYYVPRAYAPPSAYYAPRAYAPPSAYYAPRAYGPPSAYYAPRAYAAPSRYYAPRTYAPPSAYYAPRGYYPVR
ncbi:MAG: hypothetical protein ACLPX5_01015 [Dissulfurispiraceae bacterium]